MRDALELARRGFQHRFGSYAVMTLLVAFTVAGFLVVSAYWRDATNTSLSKVEPLNFPYIKATVVYAYWTNPPQSADEEFPPPRKYAPLFNEQELDRIRSISGVQSLTVALSQETFSRLGNQELLSIEDGAPMWDEIKLVKGSLPEGPGEVLIPSSLGDESLIGSEILIKKPKTTLPKQYVWDMTIRDIPDPEPSTFAVVTGVYEPSSPVVSGLIGHLPVRRVDSYPARDPKIITMEWPVPNTIFLRLSDPSRAQAIMTEWRGLYPDLYWMPTPIIPPPKVVWTPDLPETMMELSTIDVGTPIYLSMIQAFSLGAIGVFSAMFTSFLDRRKELGIMKTVGLDNTQTALTVSLEIIISGCTGTLAGIAMAQAVLYKFVRGISGNIISIPWTSVMLGVVTAALVLVTATYVPRAMAAQGTVIELLHGRPIPIFRKRT